jgi:UPF0042 nucleotide-binding protein
MSLSSEKSSIVVVTGYSGAGKSTVLRALEDIGFFCVDNLPLKLLDSFFELASQPQTPSQRVALGIDLRGGQGAMLVERVQACHEQWADILTIFFLKASSTVLLKRFQETRRRHPLAHNINVAEAIQQEKRALKPLADIADVMLKTDQLTIHQLRDFVRKSFARETEQIMVVNLISFGFKYGVPAESNFVYDVRSLPNPFFIPALKPLNGRDKPVRDYLFSLDEVQEYWEKLLDFIRYAIGKSYQEGRAFMNIAIGCTGGRHRSVALVQELFKQEMPNVQFLVTHRDISRDSY